MRPRKDVLLWGPVEDEVRRIAYIVELRLVARVYVARTLEEMIATASCVDFFAAGMIRASERQLATAQGKILQMPIVWFGPNDDMAQFLERLKIALARKRGPAKGTKKPCASVSVERQKVEAA